MHLPKDPVMLLSVINTLLRDKYESLEELAAAEGADQSEITNTLLRINYIYDQKQNQFI